MTIDISPLLQAAIGIGATALSIFGSLALQAITARWKLQVSAGQSAAYEVALSKGLAFGVTQLSGEIRANGWDHVQTQSAVVATALGYVVAREPAALAAVGLTPDPTDARTREVITQALTRALPAAFTAAAASPATPPAPADTAATDVSSIKDLTHA